MFRRNSVHPFVVVFLHVHSHMGCVVSEYVDQLAKAAVAHESCVVDMAESRRHVCRCPLPRGACGVKDGEAAAS